MGFGEGLLKDKFAFFKAISYKNLYLRGENCLQNAHFYKQKGPCLKRPLLINLDRVSFPDQGIWALITLKSSETKR